MNRFITKLLFLCALLLSLGACHREESLPEAPEARFAPIKVILVQEEEPTKSVVSSAVENFTCAYLFAFWHDSKTICTTADGAPLAIYTEQKSFDWVLPVGNNRKIDVWALVNPLADLKTTLDAFIAERTDLKEADLGALRFVCEDTEALINMEDDGMPMSGRMDGLYLESQDDPLVFTLKRLFARYDIKINASKFIECGWQVKAAKVVGAASNTEVPYFYLGEGPGFRQEDSQKLSVLDWATARDIQTINTVGDDGKSTEATTFYFLENCQGDLGPASDWHKVGAELKDEVKNCSYLSFNVIASKDGYEDRCFTYRLYPGKNADMCSNFDIVRNRQRKITLRLAAPSDGFQWAKENGLDVLPGESISIPFETTLKYSETEAENELFITPGAESLSVESITWQEGNLDRTMGYADGQRRTDYPYYGTVTLKAASGASPVPVEVSGHDKQNDISDIASVNIIAPVYKGLLEDVHAPDIGCGEIGTWGTWYKGIPLLSLTDGESIKDNPFLGVPEAARRVQAFQRFYEVTLETEVPAEYEGEEIPVKIYGCPQTGGRDDERLWYGISLADDNSSLPHRIPAKCNVYIRFKGTQTIPAQEKHLWFHFYKYVNYKFAFEASWRIVSQHTDTEVRVTPKAWFLYPDSSFGFDPSTMESYSSDTPSGQWAQCTPVSSIIGTDDRLFNISPSKVGMSILSQYLSYGVTYEHPEVTDGRDVGFENGTYLVRIHKDNPSASFPSGYGSYIEDITPDYKTYAAPSISFMYGGNGDGFRGYEPLYSQDNHLGWPDDMIRLWSGGVARNAHNISQGDSFLANWTDYNSMSQYWSTPTISFLDPADRVNAGELVTFRYWANIPDSDITFSIDNTAGFQLYGIDRTGRTVTVKCLQGTAPGTPCRLTAKSGSTGASATHQFICAYHSYYEVSFYKRVYYPLNWIFDLAFERVFTGHYAFTIRTVRDGNEDIPEIYYDGTSLSCQTRFGDKPVTEVLQSFRFRNYASKTIYDLVPSEHTASGPYKYVKTTEKELYMGPVGLGGGGNAEYYGNFMSWLCDEIPYDRESKAYQSIFMLMVPEKAVLSTGYTNAYPVTLVVKETPLVFYD